HPASHRILGDKIAGLELDSRRGIEADDGAAREGVVAVAGDTLNHFSVCHGRRTPSVIAAGSGVVAERFPPDDAERVCIQRVEGVVAAGNIKNVADDGGRGGDAENGWTADVAFCLT